MATIGSLVIGLSLGTAGLAMGLNNVESQLKAFQNRVNGTGAMTAQQAAYEGVRLAQQRVVMAQQELQVSTLRLSELQAVATTRASTLAAAQLRVQRSTMALTAAQHDLVAAQNAATAPAVASQMGGHFPYITAAATIAGYALFQFSINAARAATAFEYEMRMIQTQAGATRDEVVRLTDAVLQMAPALQTGPMDLSKVMFRLRSVGIEEAGALEAMKYAAMGARVGNADLESVTNALIATIISGIGGVEDFAHAMGLLNATVGVSNLRMEDLTSSLSSGILSTAKQFGLEFLDVGAALATMSDQAIPAEEGSTRLRISIALLAAPTQIAARELAKIGLTERALADQMRGPTGLVGALTLLKERMDAAGLDATEQSMLLKTAFGGSRSSAGILTLMNSLDLLAEKKAMIEAKSGSFMDDWAAQSETASAKFATFTATMDVLAIRIGNGLLPALTTLALILGFVADKTVIVVPLFYLLMAVISVALVRALWGAIAVLVKTAGAMLLNVVAGVAMKTMFANMGPLIAGNMAIAGAGVGGFASQVAAANLAAAGFVPVAGAMNASLAGTAATAGPVVAGLAGVNGAMAATTASSAGMIAGVNAATSSMAVAAGLAVPLSAGMNAAALSMGTAAASTGPLVAGIAGAGGAMAATTASTGPLIVGMSGASGAIASTTAATGALILPLSAAAPAGVAAAGGVAALGTASAAASPAVWSLAGAINAALAPFWAIIGAVVLGIAALALLVLNFDRVVQGLRVLAFGMSAAKVAVLEFMASVPVLGEAFKGSAEAARAELEKIREEIRKAEADIARKGSGGGLDLLGDIRKQVEAQMAAATAQAQEGFGDLNATLIELYGTSMAGVQAAAMEAGAADMRAYAKGIREAQDAPRDAFSELIDALAHDMTPRQEAARLIGQLQSNELARGLASGSPATVAAAEALKKSIIERLDEISDGAYTAAQQTWEEWYKGWREARQLSGDGSSEIAMEMRVEFRHDQLRAEFESMKSAWTDNLAPSPDEVRAAMDRLRQEISTGAASVTDAAKAFVEQFGHSLGALKDVAATAGSDMMLAIADEISSKQDAVMSAIAGLHDVITNGMSTTAQQAFLLAALAGDEIANGLQSSEPEVYARAVAARDLIIQQLDFLSDGAYSAGLKAAQQWSSGYYNGMGQWVPPTQMSSGASNLGLTAEQLAQGVKSYEAYLNSLQSSTSSFTSQYKSDMTTAFNEIKAKALEYFDAVHQKNLRAIEDARDHKNALLDAKAALNQAPVTAAQKALDDQRDAIQEWRLRQAVASASSPEEYRDAVLALQDFLAQQHIDEMQEQVDNANDKIEAQKKANDEAYREQVEAENRRYQKQKRDFERSLTALERYLKNHPEAWRRTQNEIMALLNEYGISYKSMGSMLGAEFVEGLKDQVAAAKAAADALAAAGNPGGSSGSPTNSDAQWWGTPGGWWSNPDYLAMISKEAKENRDINGNGIIGYATGVDEIFSDHIARVHAQEMILRAGVAQGVRRALGTRSVSDLPNLVMAGRALESARVGNAAPSSGVRVVSDVPSASGGVSGGKTTVVFQVGDRTFGEIADVSLYQQKAMRERNSVTRVGASRR